MERLNNGDEHFVHCSEVVPSLEVEMYGHNRGRGKHCLHCREAVTLHSVHGGTTVYNTWMVPKVIATPAAVSTLSLILSLTRPLQPYR